MLCCSWGSADIMCKLPLYCDIEETVGWEHSGQTPTALSSHLCSSGAVRPGGGPGTVLPAPAARSYRLFTHTRSSTPLVSPPLPAVAGVPRPSGEGTAFAARGELTGLSAPLLEP